MYNFFVMLIVLTEVLDKHHQETISGAKRVDMTINTSGDESIGNPRRQKFRSKKTYKLNFVCYWWTGAADRRGCGTQSFLLSNMSIDISVLTKGPNEILRHFHGARHFLQDQCSRLETPGWRVTDFKGDPLPTDELRRHREKDRMTSLVKRDRDCVLREDLLVDHSFAANPNLIVLAGISLTMEIFRFGARYGLVETLEPVQSNCQSSGLWGWLLARENCG